MAHLRVIEVGSVAEALDALWSEFIDTDGVTDLRAWQKKRDPERAAAIDGTDG